MGLTTLDLGEDICVWYVHVCTVQELCIMYTDVFPYQNTVKCGQM